MDQPPGMFSINGSNLPGSIDMLLPSPELIIDSAHQFGRLALESFYKTPSDLMMLPVRMTDTYLQAMALLTDQNARDNPSDQQEAMMDTPGQLIEVYSELFRSAAPYNPFLNPGGFAALCYSYFPRTDP